MTSWLISNFNFSGKLTSKKKSFNRNSMINFNIYTYIEYMCVFFLLSFILFVFVNSLQWWQHDLDLIILTNKHCRHWLKTILSRFVSSQLCILVFEPHSSVGELVSSTIAVTSQSISFFHTLSYIIVSLQSHLEQIFLVVHSEMPSFSNYVSWTCHMALLLYILYFFVFIVPFLWLSVFLFPFQVWWLDDIWMKR